MNTTEPFSVTCNTDETPATKPARLAAYQSIASFTDRQLVRFQFDEALRTLQDVAHQIPDYDTEETPFDQGEEATITAAVEKAKACLDHVAAIVRESAAAPLTLKAPKGDA